MTDDINKAIIYYLTLSCESAFKVIKQLAQGNALGFLC